MSDKRCSGRQGCDCGRHGSIAVFGSRLQQLSQILAGGDEQILNRHSGQPAPASAFEVVAIGRVGKAAFHAALAAGHQTPAPRAAYTIVSPVDVLLVHVSLYDPATIRTCALASQRALAACPWCGAVAHASVIVIVTAWTKFLAGRADEAIPLLIVFEGFMPELPGLRAWLLVRYAWGDSLLTEVLVVPGRAVLLVGGHCLRLQERVGLMSPKHLGEHLAFVDRRVGGYRRRDDPIGVIDASMILVPADRLAVADSHAGLRIALPSKTTRWNWRIIL